MQALELWNRYKKYFFEANAQGFSLDISRINFDDAYLNEMKAPLDKAFEAMQALEAGAIANPDENRMVGHYWLRNSKLAPSKELAEQVDSTLANIVSFANKVISGEIVSEKKEIFKYILLVGIGGSALGPQFLNKALSTPQDPTEIFFFDNTDPDGMERVLASIPNLSQCLCIVISKSGGTKETRNGMLVAEAAFQAKGLEFAKHACAVTGENSELDKYALKNGWIARFPMFDWIGGRTSELSAVGLLPAALQGVDVYALLKGAKEMDELTRQASFAENPAARLALMWFKAVGGRGNKDMVILPYNDRLELFSKYLQQLVMESLGKEKNLTGEVVNQGIAVYGNKGSTDQHAYIQQLRDGVNNFFAVFIRVLKDRSASTPIDNALDVKNFKVEPGVTSGDYLSGFFQGTREALYQNQRESVTITINEVTAYSIGQLIALFERTVGLYASLVGINAYHQPGVEAGKKAATTVLDIQAEILKFLASNQGFYSVEQIAESLGTEKSEKIFLILQHLSANQRVSAKAAKSSLENLYSNLQ